MVVQLETLDLGISLRLIFMEILSIVIPKII